MGLTIPSNLICRSRPTISMCCRIIRSSLRRPQNHATATGKGRRGRRQAALAHSRDGMIVEERKWLRRMGDADLRGTRIYT